MHEEGDSLVLRCADSKQVAIILLLVDDALEIFLGRRWGKGERFEGAQGEQRDSNSSTPREF